MDSTSLNMRLDSGKEIRVRIRSYEDELFASVTALDGKPLTLEELYEARDTLNKIFRENRVKVRQG